VLSSRTTLDSARLPWAPAAAPTRVHPDAGPGPPTRWRPARRPRRAPAGPCRWPDRPGPRLASGVGHEVTQRTRAIFARSATPHHLGRNTQPRRDSSDSLAHSRRRAGRPVNVPGLACALDTDFTRESLELAGRLGTTMLRLVSTVTWSPRPYGASGWVRWCHPDRVMVGGPTTLSRREGVP
jgi:hypothetical protein